MAKLRALLLVPAIAAAPAVGGAAAAKTFTRAKNPCLGTDKADTITDTNSPEKIKTLEGRDDVDGFGGADTILGGPKRVLLYGMGGEDYVYGGTGNDLLHAYFSDDVEGTEYNFGGEGDDDVWGGYGADRIEGGKSADVLNDQFGPTIGRPADVDFVNGGSGANSVDVFDGDALDVVCNGSFVQSDPGDGVNSATCP